MPDAHGFDHIGPHKGYHRCVECAWPGYGVSVSEAQRERHAAQHQRQRDKELAQARAAALRVARRAKAAIRKENRGLA